MDKKDEEMTEFERECKMLEGIEDLTVELRKHIYECERDLLLCEAIEKFIKSYAGDPKGFEREYGISQADAPDFVYEIQAHLEVLMSAETKVVRNLVREALNEMIGLAIKLSLHWDS